MSDSSPMNQMLAQFKDLSELQAFANAQQRTIIELTKKLKKAEDETKHLKSLLEKSVPLIESDESKKLQKKGFLTNDEESICRQQLFLLNQMSAERELTLEESKRVEIFSKILRALEEKPKTVVVESRTLSTEELLASVQTDGK